MKHQRWPSSDDLDALLQHHLLVPAALWAALLLLACAAALLDVSDPHATPPIAEPPASVASSGKAG